MHATRSDSDASTSFRVMQKLLTVCIIDQRGARYRHPQEQHNLDSVPAAESGHQGYQVFQISELLDVIPRCAGPEVQPWKSLH